MTNPIKINRDQFLKTLESVLPGLSKAGMLDQADCFVFSNGKVWTYNDDACCRTKSGLPKEVTGAVKSDPLLELVRKLEDEELDVSLGEGELLVTSGKGRRKSGLRLEGEITLPLSQVEKVVGWKELPEELTEAMTMAAQCANDKHEAFVCKCVHIHPKWVEASDKQQLCRWTMETGLSKASLVRQLSVKDLNSLGMNEYSEGEGWLHFRNKSGLTVSVRRYVGEEFPDLSFALEKEPGASSVSLPKALSEASDRAQIFSKEDENNRVWVDLKPGKVTVKGIGVTGWYSESRPVTDYAGERLRFLISPVMLSDIVKRHNSVIVGKTRLLINGGGPYAYVASLILPGETTEAEEAPPEPVDASEDE